jgi:radical SAM protein with 4Fe4S-binding SPASM domain
LCAENQLSGTLQQGTDGDISIIEELMTRPDAYRIMLMDTRMDACVVKHEGKPDGYELGKDRGIPCSARQAIIINPNGIAKPCSNLPITFGNMHKDCLKQVLENELRDKLMNGDQRVMMPACGKHDYCSYCNIPCFAGQPISWTADGLPVFEKPTPAVCDPVKIRMEVGRMLLQGIDPLGGKTIEECLAALPVEPVPVFR